MIRNARPEEIDKIMPLFDEARSFMRKCGNSKQWINGYPNRELIVRDIEEGNFYVDEEDGIIAGCFSFIIGEEPTYLEIDGNWLNDSDYGTIHRLASNGRIKGIADRCFSFCKSKISNLRADTHRDNHVMQAALERNGFRYCGIIKVADGSERLAYQSV